MRTVGEVLRILWSSLKAYWENLFFLAVMNGLTALPLFLFFAALSYGGPLVAELGSSVLLVVLLVVLLALVAVFPPAVAGLWNVGNLVADELAIHWSDYFSGFRRYFWKSIFLVLIAGGVLIIMFVNIWFYGTDDPFLGLDIGLSGTLESIAFAIRIFFVLMTVLWLIYLMYPMAMLLEQTDQRLRTALRNSFVLLVSRPGFAILLALVLGILAVISTVFILPWFLFTLAFFAIVCNKAVKHLLVPFRERMASEADEDMADEEEVTGEVEAAGGEETA